jgi:dihydroorotate dehydrogenase
MWDQSPIPRCYWDEVALPSEARTTMDGTEALINPGYKRMAEYIKEVKPLADKLDAHIIGSFSPRTIEEAGEMAREYEKAGASGIHMDLVCSTAAGFRGRQLGKNYDKLGKWWSQSGPEKAAEAMKAVTDAVDIPVCPKAYFYQWARENPEIIRRVEEVSNVDAISINTYSIPNTVRIDIYRGKPYTYPRFDNLQEALMPLTVGNTYALAKAATKPILTAGGITTAHDVIELTMAGATALGFCRSIYKDIHVIEKAVEGIEAYMASQAIESLDDIRGIALRHPVRFPDGLSPEHEEQVIRLATSASSKVPQIST